MLYSDYELVRLENIQKNNQFLKDIGINTSNNDRSHVKIPQKKKREVEKLEPTRKSSRFVDKESVDYKEVVDQTKRQSNQFNGKFYIGETESHVKTEVDIHGQFIGSENLDLTGHVKSTSEGNNSSSSSINANKSLFLQSYLSKSVAQYGKACVMAMSNGGVVPRFSKYSGVVEWRNAVYLWVNIGGKTGYHNSFSGEGRFIMWYGGSRMHADSPITTRLLRTGNMKGKVSVPVSDVSDSDGSDDILLFTRLEGGSYICLGRLGLSGYDLSKEPISMQWELLDFERIKDLQDFKNILKESV